MPGRFPSVIPIGRNTPGIQNRFGALFFMVLHVAFLALSSLPTWHEDRLLFVRERASGVYGTAAYFLSVVAFDFLPLRLAPPLAFAGLAYWMIGLNTSSLLHPLRFLLAMALGNTTASSLSLAIGAATESTAVANLVGSLAMLGSMLLGGFLLSRQQLPGWLQVASRLSYVR